MMIGFWIEFPGEKRRVVFTFVSYGKLMKFDTLEFKSLFFNLFSGV